MKTIALPCILLLAGALAAQTDSSAPVATETDLPASSATNQAATQATNPVTAEVWAEHSFWPQDPQIPLAIAGGITTIQALPGSANLIGGRSAILKLIPARTVQEMKFPGAHYGLKMACGENPKRVYGRKGGPSTRMGNMAGYRAAFIDAERYRRTWDAWLKNRKGDPPSRSISCCLSR